LMKNGTKIPAFVDLLGWGNPMGGLFSSARDMSEFLSLLFRNNAPANQGSQILDGFTINEMLTGVSFLNDGRTGFGLPYELFYDNISKFWTSNKAGELAGYRSQIAFIPALKIGVFASAFISSCNEPTDTVFTIPVIDILAPALQDVLWTMQPPYSLPSNTNQLIGVYTDDPDSSQVNISVQNGVLYGLSSGTSFNLTSHNDSLTIFRAVILQNDTVGLSCRSLYDGCEDEFIYFNITNEGHATSLVFMGGTYIYSSEYNDFSNKKHKKFR